MTNGNDRERSPWPANGAGANPETEPLSTEVTAGTLFKGRYRIEQPLNSGSFGVVYRAQDTRLNARRVVIKILLEKLGGEGESEWRRQKFQDEIKAISQINHPAVVIPLDIGETADGLPYLVMEYVPGQDLHALLRQRGAQNLDFKWIAGIVLQLGKAVSAAHEQHVLHRDFKPANIMVQTIDEGEERIKVIDFGIASIRDQQTAAAETTTRVAGTPAYMAPEQFEGRASKASDIYALGMIAYELVTGELPFKLDATTEYGRYQQLYKLKREGVTVKPKSRRPSLSDGAEALIMRALAPRPEDRPPRARDWAKELARALTAPAHAEPGPGETTETAQTLHTAHVLFMDLVEFSQSPMDEQARIRALLDRIINVASEFQRGRKAGDLISLDTGDGMALVFLSSPESPVLCAEEVTVAARAHPEIRLRMGVHTGAVYLRRSIDGSRNVTGPGINLAQRVMDCGDAGHILVSKGAAEELRMHSRWARRLHDLGECQVKHGVKIHVFSLYTDTYGNSAAPNKILEQQERQRRQERETKDDSEQWRQERETKDDSPPHTAPPKPILTRPIAVHYERDYSDREALVYVSGKLEMEDYAPDSELAPIKWEELRRHIDNIRECIDRLNERAKSDDVRGKNDIERVALEMSRDALPEVGLRELSGPGISPQFDVLQDFVTSIPWEVLEEENFFCPLCELTLSWKALEAETTRCKDCGGQMVLGYKLFQCQQCPATEAPHCRSCGGAMKPGGGKLALTYHLTHLARVRGRARAGAEGNDFLFIEDPYGDLCSPGADPRGIVAAHLESLHQLVKGRGYRVNLITRENATIGRVLKELERPSVVGVYYFGHGFFPRQGSEGCLLLRGGTLYASQIEKIKPAARLVFINACSGAAAGRDWDLEKKASGVAHAFARSGPGRVVIAPLWPVVNVQAAEMALAFFENALPPAGANLWPPLGEALKQARLASHARYEAGEPHIAWMAYRYFGDPNKSFPLPAAAAATKPAGRATAYVQRIFDANEQLNPDFFAFPIDEVLASAARVRNAHGRERVTAQDLLAGLIQKGDLTRWLLRQAERDPDKFYEELRQPRDAEGGRGAAASGLSGGARRTEELTPEDLNEVLAQLLIRRRSDLDDSLIALLEKADEAAQHRSPETEDRRISEQLLLESLAGSASWRELVAHGFPPVEAVRQWFAERARAGALDENGALTLAALDAQAKEVIGAAHELSQQLGVFPIRNRLLLAAFMIEDEELAAQLCAGTEVEKEFLMLALLTTMAGEAPLTFALSWEACEHIVAPVLEQAGKLAADPRAINRRELFRAFCLEADPEFKDWLLDLGIKLNEEEEKPAGPKEEKEEPTRLIDDLLGPLDPSARRVIHAAHALAQKRRVLPIPNRLLLAAFLMQRDGEVTRLFEQRRIPVNDLSAQLISLSSGEAPSSFPLTPEACERAITPALKRAGALREGAQPITEAQLFKAFCEATDPNFKRALKQGGVDLDMLGDMLGAAMGSTKKLTLPSPLVPDFDHAQFTEDAWLTLVEATQLACQEGRSEIRSPHLFAGMIGTGTRLVGLAFHQQGVSPEKIRRAALSLIPALAPPSAPPSELRWSDNAAQAVQRALQRAKAEGRAQATEQDLLLGFLADGGGVVGALLQQAGLDLLRAPGRAPDPRVTPSQKSVLASIGRDLTAAARDGKLPAIAGRDKEIETALQTLLLTENANPLLVGEAGVGKTAIVEGIAQRIVQGHCHEKLQAMRLIEISAADLVSATPRRGEFEQRVSQLIAEARENVILFIDEIHTIVGAGSAGGGSLDAGNMIKAALARGELKLIGATTHSEYQRTIAHDKALSRRFQAQMINPPSREAALKMVAARQIKLEQDHDVRVTKAALLAAVDLSGQYLPDRQWPAKARDVLERACVRAASNWKRRRKGRASVTAAHVAEVIANITGIPLERVSTGDQNALAMLEERLARRIIGQPESLRLIADAIRRGQRGLADANRPWGVFLIVGPSGVGKTELAKALAEEIYGGEDGLIRFNMGDFTEPNSAARLTGAAPGYIGYEQGSPLVKGLRARPYSLLLFDEIEHAHPNVWPPLLQLMAEGVITDSAGNLADARNAIVIMTSNLLGREQEYRRPGFSLETNKLPEALSQFDLRQRLERSLPVELIDRFDSIIRLNPLTDAGQEQLCRERVQAAVANFTKQHGLAVEVGPEVVPWLVRQAPSESSGARAIIRVVEQLISGGLGNLLMNAAPARGARVRISVIADELRIEIVSFD